MSEEDSPIKPDSRVNDQIRVSEVRLISQDGEQLGIVPIEDALERARTAQLDLVEVAGDAKPPVCRIFDYKKVMYEQKRKLKESRKKGRASELKEIKMRVIIDPHDRATKLRKAREALERGDKVKFTLQFRGREITKPQLGEKLITAIMEDMQDIAEVEKPAQKQGRFVHLIVTRRKDWKPTAKNAAPAAADAS